MFRISLLFILSLSFAKPAISQTDTIKIKTSATCEMCKKNIEEYLSFEKGVKRSNLDLETNIVTVVYNPEKTNPEKIKIAITKSGYDADSLPADQKAYKRLPACCKKSEK